jgi:CO/xanthine dehydrogenase Mo-binding subunit
VTSQPSTSPPSTSPPSALAAHPRLDAWLDLSEPGAVAVSAGRVELGQGVLTAFAAIAAHELDVDPARVRTPAACTEHGPDGGVTSGSMSVAEWGAALRQACAEARAVLLAAAAARLQVPVTTVEVHDGHVRAPDGRGVGYWELEPARLLDRAADGCALPKPPGPGGPDLPRLDLPDKVLGRPRYVHDLRLPGQLYGRVVRPPAAGAVLVHVDPGAADGGVTVVREGSFLGVVAEREEVAVRSAAALAASASWSVPTGPEVTDLRAWLRATAGGRTVVADDTGTSVDSDAVVAEVRASYSRPFLAHASIAPSCAVAFWAGARVQVWSHTQGVHPLRRAIAQALDLASTDVVVQHVEGAGCYGHNGADDAAFDAVLLARAVPGRAVQVVWSRADELSAAPFGPGMVADLSAGVDAEGRVRTWRHETWSQGHTARPGYAGTPGLRGALELAGGAPAPPADPKLPAGGALRNADPIYAFPARHVVGRLSRAAAPRASALRSLGAFLNVFAIESFMDELAALAGADPLAYRLAQLSDPRARAVLERAATVAGWAGRDAGADGGFGIAVARYKGSAAYCSVVAEVEAGHEVRVRRLVLAVDAGRVISHDGLAHQIEGGAVQATSWTLLEQARFDRNGPTSTDWSTYPILRFSQVPPVTVEILDRPDQPSLGAGEAALGPTAAAIANAVRDALGVPVRDLPLTPERIIEALG